MRSFTALLREYVFPLSIILIIVGFILLLFGIFWYAMYDMVMTSDALSFIASMQEWNAFVLVAGLIIFAIGLYYLYSYLSKRSFILKEIQTSKRSEFCKRHKEVLVVVKHLPSKYHTMVREKEKELHIK